MGNKDIKLKHKVQLRKKAEGPINGGDESNPPKSKNWIWWIVAIVILCLIGFLVLSKSDKKAEQEPVVEIVEKVTNEEPVEAIPSDSVTEAMAVENSTADEATVSADESSVDSDTSEQGLSTVPPESANIATTISSTDSNISNDVEVEAMKVIRGDYGIGQERKDRLGAKYQTIQNRVNELKREGVF